MILKLNVLIYRATNCSRKTSRPVPEKTTSLIMWNFYHSLQRPQQLIVGSKA